jgi:uncharacterized membrane-anchored protein YitT (DUF2179 family)
MKILKDYLLLTLASAIVAIGLSFFLAPNHIVMGGLGGFSTLINTFVPNLNIGQIMLILNAFLFIIAFSVIGSKFAIRTIYCTVVLSAIVWLIDIFFKDSLIMNNLVVNMLLGVFFDGLGSGLLFYLNASTGGIDILGKIISKYTKCKIGTATTIANLLIVLGGFLVYGPLLGGISLLGRFIHGYIINYTISAISSRKPIRVVQKAAIPEKVVVSYNRLHS